MADLTPIGEVIERFYAETQPGDEQDRPLDWSNEQSTFIENNDNSNDSNRATSSYEEVFLDLAKIIQKYNEQHGSIRTNADKDQDTKLCEEHRRRNEKETDVDRENKIRPSTITTKPNVNRTTKTTKGPTLTRGFNNEGLNLPKSPTYKKRGQEFPI